MCVILVADSKPLTLKLVRAAMTENPHGNGIAWLETEGKKKTVHFEKGLGTHEVEKMIAARDIPLPYVFHARIASVGKVCDQLTHPFVVGPRDQQLRMRGKARKGVLFHNGTWMGWSAFYRTGTPAEIWSDSRAMADLVQEFGESALDFIPETQKIVRVTSDGIETHGSGWIEVGKGILASNPYFLRHLENRKPALSVDTCKLTSKNSDWWFTGKGEM